VTRRFDMPDITEAKRTAENLAPASRFLDIASARYCAVAQSLGSYQRA
jgi:hypothetical protein